MTINNLKIYGNPYHSLDYYFLNKEEIFIILFENDANLETISSLDFIDGVFSLFYENEDYLIIVSDPYGLYPLFYNKKELKVIDSFSDCEYDYKINNEYVNSCKKNLDKSYHSALSANNLQDDLRKIINKKCFDSPFKEWKIVQPGCVVKINKKTKIEKSYYYNVIDINEKYLKKPEELIEDCILFLSKNKKVLVPLSSGYDSRTIFSILYKNRNVSRYTYGKEKEFVDSNFINIPNCIEKHFIDFENYDKYVLKYCLEMNGMGDIYYKIHNFFIQDNYLNYDIMFTGDGNNEFVGNHKNTLHLYYSARYATGDGHHYKTQAKKIKAVPPYCQKRLLSAIKGKNSDMLRREICINLINKYNSQFLDIPFYSGDEFTKNMNSNFGHEFSYNTKEKYLNTFFEVFFSVTLFYPLQ